MNRQATGATRGVNDFNDKFPERGLNQADVVEGATIGIPANHAGQYYSWYQVIYRDDIGYKYRDKHYP